MKALLSIFFVVAVLRTLDAADITGVVQSGSARSATVRVDGELMPAIGDKAEIFFKLAGGDDEISVANGAVSKVDGSSAEIKIENSTGEIVKDQLVRIKSEKPQKKNAAAPGANPSSATAAGTPASVSGRELSLVGRWSGKVPSGGDFKVVFKEDGTAVATRPGGTGESVTGKYSVDSTTNPVSFQIDDLRPLAPLDATDEEMKEFEKNKGEIGAEIREVVFLGEFDGPARIRLQPFRKSETTPQPKLGLKAALLSRASQAPGGTNAAALSPSAPAGAQARPGHDGSDPSFAFVDMNQIFKDFSKTKTAEATINSARAAAKGEYDDRVARKLPADELAAWRADREKELQEQAAKMRTDLVTEITAALKKVAPADVNLIWDRSGLSLNGVPLAVFSPPDTEMSGRVSSVLAGRGDAGPAGGLRGLQVGLVDMNQIFKNYTKTQKAETKINASKNAAKQEYDKRAGNYKKEMAKIDTLSVAARDKQIAKVRALEPQVNGWRVGKEKELQAEAVKLREGIVKDITDAISARLSGQRSPLILDKTGNGSNGMPGVLWSSGIVDFSSEIIEGLNAGRKSSQAVSLTSSSMLKLATIDIGRAFRAMPEGITAGGKELPELDAKAREPVVAKLTTKVSEVAQAAGHNLIIDSSGLSLNGVPFAVRTNQLPDLTDELIARVK